MTHSPPQKPARRPRAPAALHPGRHTVEAIPGRYRRLTVTQLALATWLLREGRVTYRQFRAWWGIHEMAERRNYGVTRDGKAPPRFTLSELRSLIGGASTERAMRDLAGDVRALSRVGLVVLEEHRVRFAGCLDDLTLDGGGGEEAGSDPEESFAGMLAAIPNPARTVPVPRRLIRALAAGFRRAESLYIVAALIRSLFWDRRVQLYTTDGRLKGSWVAQTFQLSRRAVTAARQRLITLGWLMPLKVAAWEANRYGVHDVIDVSWQPPATVAEGRTTTNSPPAAGAAGEETSSRHLAKTPSPAGRSASPSRQSATESASPCLNRFASSSRNQETRRPGPRRPGPAGLSRRARGAGGAPTLTDVQPADLSSTDRLLALHTQAVAAGLPYAGEAGRLDFLALANRALCRGIRPGALFTWLLRQQRTDWITAADEDAAAARLRSHHAGPDDRRSGDFSEKAGSFAPAAPFRQVDQRSPPAPITPPTSRCYDARSLTEDERAVERCILVSKRLRLRPERVARIHLRWSDEDWRRHYASYSAAQAQQWSVYVADA